MRLLLLSNSTNPGEAYLEHAQQHIKSFLGSEVSKVLFIPFAGVSMTYDEYTRKTSAAYNQLGYDMEGIHQQSNMLEAVKEAEAIAVGGGNTFHLLKEMYDNSLVEAIREKVAAGMPYMGWSAGSNVASPSIRTTNDMPIIEPRSFESLNLVPFQINPHYTEGTIPNHGGESRKQRILEFLEVNPGMPVVCIPEGTILHVEGNRLNYLGSKEGKIFLKNKPEKIITGADDLSWLLEK